MNTDHGITGAIINGRYIRRHHHNFGNVTFLDITPLLRRGRDNEIQVLLPGAAQQRRIGEEKVPRTVSFISRSETPANPVCERPPGG